ncbi:hypothetical protein AUQ48_04865 [Kocuria flava]|uniref:Uncharacterized protein n=1 Tax=Kocuria flava TaxID=446860 RepID=A0A2N4T0D5_9MICC|nr:hypothetical protein AUQ48_04865 [Kocuria flava]
MPSGAGARSSGRIPTVTSWPVRACCWVRVRATRTVPTVATPSVTRVRKRFIAGEPMNPATNSVAGAS